MKKLIFCGVIAIVTTLIMTVFFLIVLDNYNDKIFLSLFLAAMLNVSISYSAIFIFLRGSSLGVIFDKIIISFMTATLTIGLLLMIHGITLAAIACLIMSIPFVFALIFAMTDSIPVKYTITSLLFESAIIYFVINHFFIK